MCVLCLVEGQRGTETIALTTIYSRPSHPKIPHRMAYAAIWLPQQTGSMALGSPQATVMSPHLREHSVTSTTCNIITHIVWINKADPLSSSTCEWTWLGGQSCNHTWARCVSVQTRSTKSLSSVIVCLLAYSCLSLFAAPIDRFSHAISVYGSHWTGIRVWGHGIFVSIR